MTSVSSDSLETVHLQPLLASFAACSNRQQAKLIAYLVEENRMLEERLEAGRREAHVSEEASGTSSGDEEIRELTVRMAEENPSWGYIRIQGAPRHLDHRVAAILQARSPVRPHEWRRKRR